MKRRIWRGPGDLWGRTALTWDDEGLRVAVWVYHGRATPWRRDDRGIRGDGIGMRFVPALSAQHFVWSERELQARGEFCEFESGIGSDDVTLHRWAGGRRSSRRIISQAAVTRNGRATVYRIAIPWDELKPFRPFPGAVFGWNLRIHHDHGDGQCTMEWLPNRTFGVIRVAPRRDGQP